MSATDPDDSTDRQNGNTHLEELSGTRDMGLYVAWDC